MKAKATKASALHGRSIIPLLSVLFVGILLILAIGTTYALQQRRIDSLNQKVDDLTRQLAVAQTQPQTPSSSTPSPTNQTTYTSLKAVIIKVYSPENNAKVSSPLAVVGQVPGNWSFEASFPIKLLDSKGAVVAQASGQVLGNWMVDSLVPFSAQLTWQGTPTGKGTLVLQKDNPSGLSTNDDSVSIPVEF